MKNFSVSNLSVHMGLHAHRKFCFTIRIDITDTFANIAHIASVANKRKPTAGTAMKANTKEGSSPLTLQQAADSDATLSYWKLYRWATTGLLGVKLRTWFVGATRYTTSDDIAEFNKAQNRLRNCSNAIAPSALKKRSRRARRQAKAEFGI